MKIHKKVGRAYYFHIGVASRQPKEVRDVIRFAEGLSIMTQGGSDIIVKARPDIPRVSFLEYIDFWIDPHPRLYKSTLFYEDGTYKIIDYADSENPFILHRKELMIDRANPNWGPWATLTVMEKGEGLYDDTRRIGRLKQWQELLDSKGLYYVGHELKKRG